MGELEQLREENKRLREAIVAARESAILTGGLVARLQLESAVRRLHEVIRLLAGDLSPEEVRRAREIAP